MKISRVVFIGPFPIFALIANCATEEVRTWRDAAGRPFEARIVACDAFRVTIERAGGGKEVLPLAKLSAPEAEFARRWRAVTPGAPLVDPSCPAVWPRQAAAANVNVQLIEENAAERVFSWETPHFRLNSDLRLPLGVVRDLANVFEATREVVLATPLGLHPGGERRKYQVRMFSAPDEYQRAGGPSGSGGVFTGREMLILLPNLGIKESTNGLTAEHARNVFILKHEVTHQLLRPWGWALPPWLDEGFAECVASWPYTQGRYALQNLDAALHDYLLKWRLRTDRGKLRIIAPSRLMALRDHEWRAEAEAQTAYDHYNSAALLTHYFLRHDGKGDSASLIAYLDAIRRGTAPDEAETRFLLRGRTREQLGNELQKLARRLALDVTFD